MIQINDYNDFKTSLGRIIVFNNYNNSIIQKGDIINVNGELLKVKSITLPSRPIDTNSTSILVEE